MGNTMITASCFRPSDHPTASPIKLISFGGATRVLAGRHHLAGEIMFESPDHMLCHADSFFIGKPVPSLAIDDKLVEGQTYFLLPLGCFTHNIITASWLAALGSVETNGNNKPSPVKLRECPFEYLKGSDGRVLIKVVPEFIARLISRGGMGIINDGGNGSDGSLCSTPELKRHYDQLVGSNDRNWSPKLDTICEYKLRFSPCRFIGLEWKQKEGDV